MHDPKLVTLVVALTPIDVAGNPSDVDRFDFPLLSECDLPGDRLHETPSGLRVEFTNRPAGDQAKVETKMQTALEQIMATGESRWAVDRAASGRIEDLQYERSPSHGLEARGADDGLPRYRSVELHAASPAPKAAQPSESVDPESPNSPAPPDDRATRIEKANMAGANGTPVDDDEPPPADPPPPPADTADPVDDAEPPPPAPEAERQAPAVDVPDPLDLDGAVGTAIAQRQPGDDLTDLMMSELLVGLYGGRLRYCPEFGWVVFSGQQWIRDPEGRRVQAMAKELARVFTRKARRSLDRVRAALRKSSEIDEKESKVPIDEAKRQVKDALRVQSVRAIKAMVELAAAEPKLLVEVEDFDADPMLLNCPNGTVNLRTGKLREHCAEDLLMQMTNVEYVQDATCPLWDRTLFEVFAGEDCDEVVAYVQRTAGYTLTGLTREEVFLLLWGAGRNGKGTIVETLQWVFGSYAKVAPMSLFLESNHDSSKNHLIAELRGSRMTVASETSAGKSFDVGLLKNWTGGDKRTGAFKYKNQFEYVPQDTVWLLLNDKPKVRSWGPAFHDRLHLLPFEHSFLKDDDTQDGGRKADLLEKAELEGILAWAVRGCLAWQEHGKLRPPERVKVAVEEYRRENARADEFVRAMLEHVDPDVAKALPKLLQNAVYVAYRDWSKQLGYPLVPSNQFGGYLDAAGFKREPSNRGMVVLGCRLLTNG